MNNRNLSYLAVLALVVPSLVLADPPRRHVRRKQVRQEERIGQGLKSGELTKDEAKGLQGEEKAIQAEKKEDLKDGKLSPAERRKLRRMQNKASHDIYKEKHDGETRPAAPAPAVPPTQ